MGILFGSTPAARKDSSHHQDMPYIFMSWFPERNLGLDPRLAFSIRTGTWLDFFWRGGRHACWNPRSSSEKTDDSPFGFIRLAMEVILCFFLVTSRGWVSGVPNSELPILKTLIWAQKAQVTMVPGTSTSSREKRMIHHLVSSDLPWR